MQEGDHFHEASLIGSDVLDFILPRDAKVFLPPKQRTYVVHQGRLYFVDKRGRRSGTESYASLTELLRVKGTPYRLVFGGKRDQYERPATIKLPSHYWSQRITLQNFILEQHAIQNGDAPLYFEHAARSHFVPDNMKGFKIPNGVMLYIKLPHMKNSLTAQVRNGRICTADAAFSDFYHFMDDYKLPYGRGPLTELPYLQARFPRGKRMSLARLLETPRAIEALEKSDYISMREKGLKNPPRTKKAAPFTAPAAPSAQADEEWRPTPVIAAFLSIAAKTKVAPPAAPKGEEPPKLNNAMARVGQELATRGSGSTSQNQTPKQSLEKAAPPAPKEQATCVKSEPEKIDLEKLTYTLGVEAYLDRERIDKEVVASCVGTNNHTVCEEGVTACTFGRDRLGRAPKGRGNLRVFVKGNLVIGVDGGGKQQRRQAVNAAKTFLHRARPS
jgi:hypothetical protein